MTGSSKAGIPLCKEESPSPTYIDQATTGSQTLTEGPAPHLRPYCKVTSCICDVPLHLWMQFSEVEQKALCDDSLCIGGHEALAEGQRRAAVLDDGSSVTVVVELH